ncbi:MAG: hypothetical protein PVJ49_15195 [Acidobacteriota bacterium]|jgi:hypothetical protein
MKLVFGDAEDRIITSEERVEELAGEGFLFEACASQAMIVEALMSLAMFTAVSAREDLSDIGLAHGVQGSAFGKLIELEARLRVFEDPELAELLEEYARRRAFLVDRHLPELHNFDYPAFLHTGRELLAALKDAYRTHAYELLEKQGLPTDSLFER